MSVLRRLWLLPLLLGSACEIDLSEPWEVKEPRLMGARVEVEGDPARTRPRIGERFDVRQYLALPPAREGATFAAGYDVAAALCLAYKAPGGELTCIGEQTLTPRVETLSPYEVRIAGLGLDLASVAAAIQQSGVPGLPSSLDVVQLAEQFDIDRIAVIGALCVDGRAERVPDTSLRETVPSRLFRCVDNDGAVFPDVNAFTLSVLLDLGRSFDGNRNPSFACDTSAPASPCVVAPAAAGEAQVAGPLVLARPASPGAPREVIAWPENAGTLAQLPATSCASLADIPQVRAGSGKHEVRMRFDPSDRERFQYQIRQNGQLQPRDGRESLLVSHAISTGAGELDRFYSQVDADHPDERAEFGFDYEPPRGLTDSDDDLRVPEGGLLVRFYFTLRDERGGVDFTTRDLCLLPPRPAGTVQ